MKKNGSLIQLIAGLALLTAGLFWLFNQVRVTSGFGFHFYGVDINGGLIVVPFIIGVVWAFIDPKSFPAKFLIGLGIFIIVAGIIANTRFYFKSTSLYTYLIILFCIAAGLGLVIKVLFGDPKEKKKNDINEISKKRKEDGQNNQSQNMQDNKYYNAQMEEELNRIKNGR